MPPVYYCKRGKEYQVIYHYIYISIQAVGVNGNFRFKMAYTQKSMIDREEQRYAEFSTKVLSKGYKIQINK
jgi:hypothetical protein